MSLQTTLIVGVISTIIGFGSGFYTKGQFVDAGKLEKSEEALHGTAQNIVESGKTSGEVDTSVKKSDEKVDQAKTAVTARFAKQKEASNVIPLPIENVTSPVCPKNAPLPFVDFGVVRLLNTAREGRSVDSADVSDAAIAATADAGR